MLSKIKGVGPKTILLLNELNIYTLEDLVSYYPYRYNLLKPSFISDCDEGTTILINGYIEGNAKIFYIRKNLSKITFKFNTGNELINVVIFNRMFIKKNLVNGKFISIIGKYDKKKNIFLASDIKLTPIINTKIESIYHLNRLFKKNTFVNILKNALNSYEECNYNIPQDKLIEYNFISKREALMEIHFPTSSEKLKKARLALIYEELFEFMLKINKMKENRVSNNFLERNFCMNDIDIFINHLDFELTIDQKKAIGDIEKDMLTKKIMNRLLIGDVGSGKTIVAFIALYMNYLSGYQGVMMAPTEILAIQHYENALKLFRNYNIKFALLTSSTGKKERNEILDKLKLNEIDVLIGTHSVLNDEVVFKNIGLVITDEQHRFGVKQRKTLQNKGIYTDVLFMSATPIPRTLALTLFGDMDISEIKTKPKNRKPVYTRVYKTKEIKEVLSLMLEEIKNNHQVYVVAPMIEEDEDIFDVNSLYNSINDAFQNRIPIDMLHGKLASKEKDKIISRFKNNETKILISTTVIEVGVDVKNATMMVIFNGERFGLATLHQLRGRIGRNDLESKCLIVSNYNNERLKIMEQTNDGFEISEKDFELRGSGDLFGVRQSGEMSFKIADLKRDYKILVQCDLDSKQFLKML